ncbi:hypothetical protein [Bacillus sp. CGMCC 1.16541]|uniref:hypothetical protein n=1 Tax=Bacillus sp. CGMCC 1.16541 TaxID=2185143 RepID=UPI0019515601|nr:hypothetical protein [Bacillus sp. CGMCC 1.16541]
MQYGCYPYGYSCYPPCGGGGFGFGWGLAIIIVLVVLLLIFGCFWWYGGYYCK